MICSISSSVSGFPWFHGSILWNEYLLYLKLEVVFVVYCLNLNQCSYDAGLFSSRVCSVETTFSKDLGFRCYHVAAQVWWQDIASGANGHAAKLEHLRVEALDKGRDWLQGEVARVDWQEVRQLVQAAGLQVRSGGHGGSWLQVGALREALVKHLEPQAMSISKDLCQIGKRKVAGALL